MRAVIFLVQNPWIYESISAPRCVEEKADS